MRCGCLGFDQGKPFAFIKDNAFSHGAAMAFYAATSLALILLIVVAVAGIAFGHQAAQVALSAQISEGCERRPLQRDGSYAAFRRVPAKGNVRSNIHAAGTARKFKVTDKILALAEIVRPKW